MPIPDFQSAMLPVLKFAGDGKEHTLAETVEAIAREFKVTEEERNEVLPSGRKRRLNNRVGWAKTYLQKAGLLESVGWGRFKVTEQGRSVLANPPPAIGIKFLDRFPGFVGFRHEQGDVVSDGQETNDAVAAKDTPDEVLQTTFAALQQALADEILAKVKAAPPAFFESLVVDLLVKMGYGNLRTDAGEVLGKTGDGGIDGRVTLDPLAFDAVCVQAKRWEDKVPVSAVRDFAGGLDQHRGVKRGVMVTTSDFPKSAYDYVGNIDNKRIALIDGKKLAELMIQHNLGVEVKETLTLKKVNRDFFGDEE